MWINRSFAVHRRASMAKEQSPASREGSATGLRMSSTSRAAPSQPGHLRALLTRQTITSSPPSDRPVSNVEEHMNTKRWLLASVAVFVVIGVLEFLVHGVLLSGLYKQTASVWRAGSEVRANMWVILGGEPGVW